MGYYTDYSLNIELHGENADDVSKALDELDVLEGIDEYGGGMLSAYANAKWYDWEADLCNLSIRFPKVFIEVEGSGEESGDLWKAYIQNGAIQNCLAQIVYDDYNPTKMHQLVQPLAPNFKAPVADLI